MLKPSATEIEQFILQSFPTRDGEPAITIDAIDKRQARLILKFDPSQLRPGATLSGPTLMMLADSAAWALILHNLGLAAAPSVTSNFHMSFLSRPASVDLIAHATLLKLGKRLAVSESPSSTMDSRPLWLTQPSPMRCLWPRLLSRISHHIACSSRICRPLRGLRPRSPWALCSCQRRGS